MRDPLDRYYTPDPVARACVDVLCSDDLLTPDHAVLEPSCGGGAFIRALKAAGVRELMALDLDPDAAGLRLIPGGWSCRADFLQIDPDEWRPDWIIGNPPYTGVEAHILRAIQIARVGVAMLLRISTLEGLRRYQQIWSPHQPAYVWYLVRRPAFTGPTVTGTQTDNATYVWVVWHRAWAEEYAEARWLEVPR